MRFVFHAAIALALTFISMFGGIAWLAARFSKRKWLTFFASYFAFSIGAIFVAPQFGRVPLPCFESESLRVQSPLYCLLNRNYVTPSLAQTLFELGEHVDAKHPGTTTLVLDANFPFFDGFPLPPHLSHDDGEKVDLGFYYTENGKYVPNAQRSPIEYFAFEQGETSCVSRFPTLRWDLQWLRPLMRDLQLDYDRMRTALNWLSNDDRIGKILLEPHIKDKLGLRSEKIRFQGCRAARHDDHIHIQL